MLSSKLCFWRKWFKKPEVKLADPTYGRDATLYVGTGRREAINPMPTIKHTYTPPKGASIQRFSDIAKPQPVIHERTVIVDHSNDDDDDGFVTGMLVGAIATEIFEAPSYSDSSDYSSSSSDYSSSDTSSDWSGGGGSFDGAGASSDF